MDLPIDRELVGVLEVVAREGPDAVGAQELAFVEQPGEDAA